MDKYIFKVCMASLGISTALYAISLEKSERVQKVIEREKQTPSFSAEKNSRILNIVNNYKEDKAPYPVERCLESLEENLSAPQQPERGEVEFSILNLDTNNFFDTKTNTLHIKFNEHPRFQAESMISICSVLTNYQIENGLIEVLNQESIKAYKYAALLESINFFTHSEFIDYIKKGSENKTEYVKISSLPSIYAESNSMNPFLRHYPLLARKTMPIMDLAKTYFFEEQTLPNQYSQNFLDKVNAIKEQEKSRESGRIDGLGRF